MTAYEDLTWAEAWGLLGAGANEKLSITQARLLADAYDLVSNPDTAVDAGALTEVHAQGVQHNDQSMQIQSGYRLIGQPEDPEVTRA